ASPFLELTWTITRLSSSRQGFVAGVRLAWRRTMHAKKCIPLLLLTSGLLAACGGGGDTGKTAAAAPATGSTAPNNESSSTPTAAASATAAPAPTPAPAIEKPADPPATVTPPPSDPVPVKPVVTDQPLKGSLEIVANQILFIRTNRVIYLPVTLDEFESDRGTVDMAAGSRTDHLDIDVVSAGCNPEIDGVCGVQPTAAAPAAPIAAFGIRIGKFVLPASPGQSVGNQTAVGRIAIDLTERNDSPGIGTNGVAEVMRFVIDKVEMTSSPSGELVSVKLQDGAQIHVYGRSASGAEVRENIAAPAGTVRLLPMSQVPDSHGDTTSVFLLLDLEAGFSQAGQKLSALENIAGHFSMKLTLSTVQKMVRAGGDPDTDLVGQSIKVNDESPVSGAGITGNAWIRMYPF
ncbi:MAG TPA: hypothetical protein VJ652_12640, partial [Noviherbaspirillum sp.]|nr:hypothetical protein [Noviherbaspirillum sp.]